MSDSLKTRSPLGDEKKPAPAPALTSMCSYHEGDSNHCYKQTLEFRLWNYSLEFSREALYIAHISGLFTPASGVTALSVWSEEE